jgi:hypothetical protein
MTGGAGSYRGLFAQPLLRRLALADVCARLPQGMVSITLLLVAAQHASMTVAGLVVAGYTLGQAATGPLRVRLADRRGLVRVAAVCTLGYALALAAAAAAAATLSAATNRTYGFRTRAARPVRVKERHGTGARRYLDRDARPRRTGGQAMSSWTVQRVLDAAAGMEWVPEGAIEMRTDDYRLMRYPDVVLDPTFRAAQVTWSRTARSPDEVLDEVAAHVREWALPGVAWWVSAATRPPGTEQALCDRGADMIDAVQVLAREIGGGLPELDVPDDVAVELVQDEATFRAASAVTVQGWERAEPGEIELAHQYQEAIEDLATWSSFRVVALVDNEPVSTGGCSLSGEVAQLWGAVTLPASRGRGSYRAVPAERLRLAREHGATLALVKGRVLTSGPILLRAGFADYGEERCYWLPVG